MRAPALRTVALGALGLAVWCAGGNASWVVGPPPEGATRLLAHRGVHQPFDRTGLTRDTCTAAQSLPVAHHLLENTLPSMAAAFAAGAEVVELDVHPTTDGALAVFHDWTLDCRTDGTGRVRDHTMDALRALDLGHGYTSDGGATFPLRGLPHGPMPTLAEVFAAFPRGRFLVNIKSDDTREVELLDALLTEDPARRAQVWGVYGAPRAVAHAASIRPELRGFSKATLRGCLLRYLAIGWSGWVPQACRDTILPIPSNAAPWLWGWPHRFTRRMAGAGTEVVLLGPISPSDAGSTGIDHDDQLQDVPRGFAGWVWTNRIEWLGPALTTSEAP